jgi:hypothetical protein
VVGERRGGAEQEITQWDGFGAESGEIEGFVGKLEFAGENGLGRRLRT